MWMTRPSRERASRAVGIAVSRGFVVARAVPARAEGLLGAIRVFADASGATGAPRDARTCEASLAGATAARPP